MSEALAEQPVAVSLAAAHAAVDDLFDADLTVPTDAELLDSYRELERLSRRLAAVEHAFLAEVEDRSLPFTHGARSTTSFLRELLRLHPADATARVKAAHECGPRRAVTSEPLDPAYPQVAAAQAAGEISARHAQTIVRTIETLPDRARAEHGAQVEKELVEFAAEFDPHRLAQLGQHVHDCLDPDGRLRDSKYRERTRHVNLSQRADGSARLSGELTPECAERLLAALDALAAPKPAVDGEKDPRTPGQRRHDALNDLLAMLQRADTLPTAGGVSTTLIITMSEDAYRTGAGTATTGRGAVVPAGEALRWAGGDPRLLAVALNKTKRVEAYSTTARLFNETQRLALIARDKGCSFPACDAPPSWCEAHHIQDWADGGETSLDNGTLVCKYYHDHFTQTGWTCIMQHGRPAWIPPPHIDPDQKPRVNHLHNTELRR